MAAYSRVRSSAAALFSRRPTPYRIRSINSASSAGDRSEQDQPPFMAALNTLIARARARPPPAAPTTPAYVFPWSLLNAIYIRGRFQQDAQLAADKVDAEEWLMEHPNPETARFLHSQLEPGSVRDLYVGNVVIAWYVNANAVDDARKVFDGMWQRDQVTCNAMIIGYASKGIWEEVVDVARYIPQGLQPNTFTWNVMIAGYFANNLDALSLISQMVASGSALDPVTVIIGLNACSRSAYLLPGKAIHGVAIRMHCDDLDQVMSALISMYSRCHRRDCARILCRGIASSCSWITCNEAVEGFASADQVDEAFGVLRDMFSSSTGIHNETLLMIASLCVRFAHVKHGRELHGFITRQKLISAIPLWNALIDMYAKLGQISYAQGVFHVTLSFEQ